jgi:60 kDa SS-A/Ro ribonucleoprotein
MVNMYAQMMTLLSAVEAVKALGASARAAEKEEDIEEIVSECAEQITTHGLVREHVPTELLGSRRVWEALLENMPMTAMVRNLGKMTNVGLLQPLSAATAMVCSRLGDKEALRRARVHPFSLLLAQRVYARGAGDKGSLQWDPVPEVTAALDRAFYAAFEGVQPTGLRWLLAVDVSGSMGGYRVNGARCITAREAAAAMAMLAARTEPRHHIVGFCDELVPLDVRADDSLERTLDKISDLPFGATDCAQPMLYALEKRLKVDVFVVYTDCETWAGHVTPAAALRRYRQETGIDAKLIVCAMTSNGFSLADPEDAGMLDVVGFDAAAPGVMREFALGNI